MYLRSITVQMLQCVSSRLTNTLPSFLVSCSRPPTKAHPVQLAVCSILQVWHETSMCTHTICTIAQLHGFIAHSQFWHAFSIFLLCNVMLRSNVFPKLYVNIIYVFLTDMLQLRGMITLSPRLSMLHGIIIDELTNFHVDNLGNVIT